MQKRYSRNSVYKLTKGSRPKVRWLSFNSWGERTPCFALPSLAYRVTSLTLPS